MQKLRVLLVPDSLHWATGTIAKAAARYNPWMEATIVSGATLDRILPRHPELVRNFDLVHFICAYAGKQWLPVMSPLMATVATHHHVTDWEAVRHNLEADAVMTDSAEWIADATARGFPGERAASVPSGVDTSTFRPLPEAARAAARARLGVARGDLAVGFFAKSSSNDDDRKGTAILRAAAIKLVSLHPGLVLVIVGPGWTSLVEALRAAGVRCVWVPFVYGHEELARIYGCLDFYWVTSRVEGGPITLLEAMSTGVCCVTTPVGIARELVVDGRNAALVPIDDVDGFVARTTHLAADRAERGRMGEAGRASILETMSSASTMRGIAGLYEAALGNYSRRTGSSTRISPRDLAVKAGDSSSEDSEIVPLHGMPHSIRREVRCLEEVAWANHLLHFHGERGMALRSVFRAWRHDPVSIEPFKTAVHAIAPARARRLLAHIRGEP